MRVQKRLRQSQLQDFLDDEAAGSGSDDEQDDSTGTASARRTATPNRRANRFRGQRQQRRWRAAEAHARKTIIGSAPRIAQTSASGCSDEPFLAKNTAEDWESEQEAVEDQTIMMPGHEQRVRWR